MATIDQQFVEYIVKTLVNNPDKVAIDRQIDEKGVLLSLTVDPEDVGRVIGRRGATAQSIRTLLRALGTKNDARYNLKIVNADEDNRPAPAAPAVEPTNLPEAPIATPVAETPTVEEETLTVEDEPADDLAEKTRAELADLDDLDI